MAKNVRSIRLIKIVIEGGTLLQMSTVNCSNFRSNKMRKDQRMQKNELLLSQVRALEQELVERRRAMGQRDPLPRIRMGMT